MIQTVLDRVDAVMQAARDTYGVDPVVFLLIYLFSVPFFYYSLYRTIRAAAKGLKNEAMFWSSVFLCAVVAPFLYVLFFGRNLPWWVYAIIALVIGQSVLSLVKKFRRTGEPATRADGGR